MERWCLLLFLIPAFKTAAFSHPRNSYLAPLTMSSSNNFTSNTTTSVYAVLPFSTLSYSRILELTTPAGDPGVNLSLGYLQASESSSLPFKAILKIPQRQSSLEMESSRLSSPSYVTSSPSPSTSVFYSLPEYHQSLETVKTHSSSSNNHTQEETSSHTSDISVNQTTISLLLAGTSSTPMTSQKFTVTTPLYSTGLLKSSVTLASVTRNPFTSRSTPGYPSFSSMPDTGEIKELPTVSLTRSSPQPTEPSSIIQLPLSFSTTSSSSISYRQQVTPDMPNSRDIAQTQIQALDLKTRVPGIAGDLFPRLCPIMYHVRRRRNDWNPWNNWDCYFP